MTFPRFFIVLLYSFLLSPLSVLANQSEVINDYHLTTYHDVQGSLNEFEAFTKHEKHRVFFGLTCSSQSPLPFLQVILFDDQVMSETPRFMYAEFRVDGDLYDIKLQAPLRVVDTADEYSNKICFEVPTKRGLTFKDLKQSYADLLSSMKAGKELSVKLKHSQLGDREMSFSLRGFKQLLVDKERICF